jgi:hypothetical protein
MAASDGFLTAKLLPSFQLSAFSRKNQMPKILNQKPSQTFIAEADRKPIRAES